MLLTAFVTSPTFKDTFESSKKFYPKCVDCEALQHSYIYSPHALGRVNTRSPKKASYLGQMWEEKQVQPPVPLFSSHSKSHCFAACLLGHILCFFFFFYLLSILSA
ncbi:hypothetical protein AMECASPLE_023536 [Ameca splendens]|uniref:Uncharacterized protein n=1 Tax=Ameca splendens TaxID=208324 RepID=A0ABV0ZZM9_9TELE